MSNIQKVKPQRWWDSLSAALLFFMMVTASSRLSATNWTSDLGIIQSVTFFAVIAGLALGQSIFHRWVAAAFAFLYGLYVVPWQLGQTIRSYTYVEWNERLVSIAGRFRVVLGEIIYQQEVSDNIFFLVLMSILFWLLVVYAAYHVTRHGEPWRAILPVGLVILVIHYFDPLVPRRTWYLAVYIFLALILLARLAYLKRARSWENRQMYIPPDAGLDFNRFILAAAVVLILVAWNAPTFAGVVPMLSNVWGRVDSNRDRFSYLFAALRASAGLVSDYYGDFVNLGRGSYHAERIVMTVLAPRYPYVGARYYWRARVYEAYEAGQWHTNLITRIPYDPRAEPLALPETAQRTEVEIEVRPLMPIISLYTASQPLSISRAGSVQLGFNPDLTVDLVGFRADPYIRPGEMYQAKSSLPSFTQRELRQAGVEYPEWISERYLQLPDTITPRTLALAQQIAAGHDNPYDIAEAVTEWLRDNIQYTEVIELPPANQESIDWFLFDYQKGFCNYYSSAEIVLLRSLGIPARWAVGYAQGEREIMPDELVRPQREEELSEDLILDVSTYIVRERDAHAWPEVYFPGYGWVEFEPTVSQVAILRPSGESSPNPQGDLPPIGFDRDQPIPDDFMDRQMDDQLSQQTGEAPQPLSPGAIILLSVSGVTLLGLGLGFFWYRRNPQPFQRAWAVIERTQATPLPVHLERGLRRVGIRPPKRLQRWAEYALLPVLTRAYLEINRAIRVLGETTADHLTPAERAEKLIKLLPLAKEPAQRLLVEYHKATYSPYPADEDVGRQAGVEIRNLSLQVRLSKSLHHVQERWRRRLEGWF